MSEIYNGTFLLGNTSATTLSAGPGIKIDSTSVPGTIKISNDETVLWSGNGTQTTGSLNLSESTTGFERIGISFFGDTSPEIGYQEFPVYSTADSFPILTNDPHIEGGSIVTMYIKWGLIKQSNNGSTLNLTSGGYNNIYGSNKGSSNACNWTKPFKIVGINRKEV